MLAASHHARNAGASSSGCKMHGVKGCTSIHVLVGDVPEQLDQALPGPGNNLAHHAKVVCQQGSRAGVGAGGAMHSIRRLRARCARCARRRRAGSPCPPQHAPGRGLTEDEAASAIHGDVAGVRVYAKQGAGRWAAGHQVCQAGQAAVHSGPAMLPGWGASGGEEDSGGHI